MVGHYELETNNPALDALRLASVAAWRIKMVLVGLDLRASAKRPSPVVVLDDDAQTVYFGAIGQDSELLDLLEIHQPELIAIGAPLGLPTGLCCLETSCSCNIAGTQKKGRQLELELSRMGISCFFTNKKSIISKLIYRGVGLNQQLSAAGYHVIEVYPHASKVILFGDKAPPKNSAGSIAFMRERLSSLVQGLEDHLGRMDRNGCDAVLNAYTALLHSRERTDMLGSPDEGLLVLPGLPR